MVIGIIGSSLSGLIAGKKLAQAGHDVTVIEKNRSLGGRLATLKKDSAIFDYGISSIISSGELFSVFMEELKTQNRIQKWANGFDFFDGSQLHDINPNRPENSYYASEDGLNNIAEYLSRWVDLKTDVRAGGLTYFGANRSKKRAWIINLTNIEVFECDAVIIAAPAPQAYGVLQTAQDETPSRRIIRHIDEIRYEPCYALAATYKEDIPEWKGIECEHSELKWIGNESSKLKNPQKTALVLRSSEQFVENHYGNSSKKIEELLLESAADIAGDWLLNPEWTTLHFWKYYTAKNPYEDFFMEMEMDEAPLALIGDYYKDNTVEAAYLSGYKLAEYWIEKFS